MLVTLLCCVALGAGLTAVGIPMAVALRGPGEGWGALAHDALAHGLVAVILIVTAATWLGSAGLAVTVAVYLAAIGWGLRSRAATGGWLPSRLRVQPWSVLLGVLTIGALALRLRYVNIVAWTGDMGGYVNWADHFARTGHFYSGFPPLFSIWLTVGAKLFGTAHTAATTPLLGVLLILSTLRLCGQLRLRPLVRVIVTGLLAVQIHALWFSSFPASESLQAPLMVMWLSLFVTGIRARGGRRLVVLVGLAAVTAALSLDRASAILLAVPLLLVLLGCLAPAWRRYAWHVGQGVAATLTGVFAGYLYGVSKIRPYYVINQLSTQLPKSLFDRLGRWGLLRVSPGLVATMLTSLLIVLALGWSGGRWRARPARTSRRFADLLVWPAPYLALVALAELAVAVHGRHGELAHTLLRIGLWVPVVGTLVAFMPAALRGIRGVTVYVAMTTAALFLYLHDKRFPQPQAHLIFLYWDRYLFSEYLPMMIIVLAIGLSAVLAALDRFERQTRVRAGASAATVLVLAVAAASEYLPADRLVVRHTMLSGAYAFERQTAELTTTEPLPVLWSATAPTDLPGVFPNSWYAFGHALNVSFGVPVHDQSGNPFTPDKVLGAIELGAALHCPTTAVYVVDVQKPTGATLAVRATDPAYTLTQVGTVTAQLPLLAQPEGGWVISTITATVWKATRTALCPTG